MRTTVSSLFDGYIWRGNERCRKGRTGETIHTLFAFGSGPSLAVAESWPTYGLAAPTARTTSPRGSGDSCAVSTEGVGAGDPAVVAAAGVAMAVD